MAIKCGGLFCEFIVSEEKKQYRCRKYNKPLIQLPPYGMVSKWADIDLERLDVCIKERQGTKNRLVT